MSRKLAIFWACIAPLGWVAVAGTGVWGFVTLNAPGVLGRDGSPPTMLDQAVPYLFLLLTPVGLYFAWKEFRSARDAIPLADAADEKARQRRQRQKEAQAEFARRLPLDEGIKREAMETLELLKRAGVIDAAEVDAPDFLDLCQVYYLESGDLYEVSKILALYAEGHGDFANALFIPDQVEVATPDIVAVIEGFARLAGRAGDLSDVVVTFANHRKRGSDGTALFDLKGVTQTLEFEHHSKNASGRLMEALSRVFDPTPPYATAYFDSIYLVTRLADGDRAALNAALDSGYETFQRLERGAP